MSPSSFFSGKSGWRTEWQRRDRRIRRGRGGGEKGDKKKRTGAERPCGPQQPQQNRMIGNNCQDKKKRVIRTHIPHGGRKRGIKREREWRRDVGKGGGKASRSPWTAGIWRKFDTVTLAQHNKNTLTLIHTYFRRAQRSSRLETLHKVSRPFTYIHTLIKEMSHWKCDVNPLTRLP